MWLARRRQQQDGIYQATGFLLKPAGKTGLKTGGYFLTLEVVSLFPTPYSLWFGIDVQEL
jgi:hypothetical protein